MLIFHRRIPFLGRFIALLGVAAFVLYWMDINTTAALVLTGPPIYLAYFAKNLIGASIAGADSQSAKDFGFMLPATLLYYAALGFLVRQLLNERGIIKIVTIIALVGFLVFIHFMTWQRLSGYMHTPPIGSFNY